MSPRYRILCYLIIVKKVFLVALLISYLSLPDNFYSYLKNYVTEIKNYIYSIC